MTANEDLEVATGKGTFRKDLFFRLNEFVIHVPSLRDRKDDITFLAQRFVALTNQELGKAVGGFSPRAEQLLLAFDWPGNVRQLRSTIRRAVLLADSLIDVEHLGLSQKMQPDLEDAGSHHAPDDESKFKEDGIPLRQLVRRATVSVERAALLGALIKTGWNKAKAARLLQIDYKTIHTKLKEYGIRTPGREDQGEEET